MGKHKMLLPKIPLFYSPVIPVFFSSSPLPPLLQERLCYIGGKAVIPSEAGIQVLEIAKVYN